MDTDARPAWNRNTHSDRLWRRNIDAVRVFAASTGTPMAPISATVTVAGETVRVGWFVAYVRQRHRKGRLEQTRETELEAIAGWTWEGLRPGPRGHAERNEEIRRLRRDGWTLTELAAEYGMSRQRIHQIAPDQPDPDKHRERLERRRQDKKKRLETERRAVERRGGAS